MEGLHLRVWLSVLLVACLWFFAFLLKWVYAVTYLTEPLWWVRVIIFRNHKYHLLCSCLMLEELLCLSPFWSIVLQCRYYNPPCKNVILSLVEMQFLTQDLTIRNQNLFDSKCAVLYHLHKMTSTWDSFWLRKPSLVQGCHSHSRNIYVFFVH